MSQAVTNMLGLPENPWHNPDGSPTALQTSAPTKKMAAGGSVKGLTDTVPAMLTPGEYVINRDAVQRIGVGNLNAMNRQGFDDGGYVQPPEVQRKTISTQASSSAPPPPPAPGSSEQPSSAPPAHPGDVPQIIKNMQDLYARRALTSQEQIAQAGGSAPGLGAAAQQAWARGINPNAGLPVGASGYVNAAGEQIAPTPGTAGYRGAMPQAASAIGGLASGLSQAAQSYAESVKPWQTQPSHIPTPPPTQPTAQLTQAQVPQPRRQQQTISPYSPYYPYTEE
jgi:hypothetical protein